MAEYINKYANDAAIQAAVDGGELIKPYVAYDEAENRIDWNSKLSPNDKPFTVEIISGSTFSIGGKSTYAPTVPFYYKHNNDEWQVSSARTTLSVAAGDVISIKGNGIKNYFLSGDPYFGAGNKTVQFKVYGNVMSLLDADNYASLTALTNGQHFKNMFTDCSGLTDASKLILPATTLTTGCYQQMFAGCTSLTLAPELPASILVGNCYYSMFDNTKITYIKCLATDISATSCTYCWLGSGMYPPMSSGTIVTPSTTNWPSGLSGIPSGWTRVNSD